MSSARARFGRRIRELRTKRGWTQEALAAKAGKHWTYIGGIERGERNPTLEVIEDLAQAQKTRGGLDAQGRKTRGYRVGHFDILGACLFNQTGKWAFRFVRAEHLARRPDDPEVFVVMHRLPYADERGWCGDLAAVIEQEIAERAKAPRRRPDR